MYHEYPKDLVVGTVLGAVKVSITDGRHAYVESNDVLTRIGLPLTISTSLLST